MMIKKYVFTGYREYGEHVDEIREYIVKSIKNTEKSSGFFIALNEILCNAARYAVDGIEKACIILFLRIEEYGISISVCSKTKPFDVVKYQEKLDKLLNSEVKNEVWYNYVNSERSIGGRGFWLMLAGCDQLVITENCGMVSIQLFYSNEYHSEPKIKELVPKLLVVPVCGEDVFYFD